MFSELLLWLLPKNGLGEVGDFKLVADCGPRPMGLLLLAEFVWGDKGCGGSLRAILSCVYTRLVSYNWYLVYLSQAAAANLDRGLGC